MSTPQISLFLLASALAALALSVWRARPNSEINAWFAAQTLLLGLWVTGIAGLQTSQHLVAWGRFAFASAILIPPAFLMFTRVFPTTTDWPGRASARILVTLGILLAILSLSTPLLLEDVFIGPRGLERRTGVLYSLYPLFFLTTWAMAFTVFANKWRRARGLARAQLQHLGAGIAIAALGGITFNLLLPWLAQSSAYNWLGPYFTLPFALLVAHAIIRHRLMDLRWIIHRGLSYAVVTAVLSIILIMIARLAYFGPRYDSPVVNAVLIVMAGLTMLTAPAQRLIRKFIDPYLYRGSVDYATALRLGMHRLVQLMEPHALAKQLREIFTEALVPDSFTLLVETSSDRLECLTTDLSVEVIDRVTAEVAELLSDRRHEIVTLLVTQEHLHHRAAARTLNMLGVEVVAVLRRRGEVLGVALLGGRRSGDPYYGKDLAFIESLSEIAAIAVDNTMLYRQRIDILEYSERLLESLDAAVIAIDVVGRVTSHNAAAADLFGLPNRRANLNLDGLPGEIGWALALAVREFFHAREFEFWIDHRVRGPVPVILSTTMLRGDDRKTTGALAIVTDLSTVKTLEQNQRRLEHVSLMARFYAGIAHEIRNPLTAISNLIAMLPDRFDDPEYRDTATRLLPMEVARITALADRLRLMAPGAGGTLSPVNLRALLIDVFAIHSPIANESGVRLSLHCPEELPRVKADPNQLIQLFVNLLRNAIEAMPLGGRIDVRVACQTTQRAERFVIVRVIDEGVGIDPAIRASVFEPFFTTKPTGTGLGLAICREIANFHGAQLALSPRRDRPGTVAEIHFPSLSDMQLESTAAIVVASTRSSA